MYHEDRKNCFIAYYVDKKPNSKYRYDSVSSVMKSLEKFEVKYNKDFCEFNEDESMDYVANFLNTRSSSTSYKYIAICKEYLRWCLNLGFVKELNQNYLFSVKRSSGVENELLHESVDSEIENSDKDFLFTSEQEFVEYIKTIFGKEKYIMDAAILVLMYYGFDYNQIKELRIKDVDGRHVNGVAIENNDMLSIIMSVTHNHYFEYERKDGKICNCCYAENEYLIRPMLQSGNSISIYNKDEISERRIKLAFNKSQDDASHDLPITSIYKNVRVSAKMVAKLRFFFNVLRDVSKHDIEYVKSNYSRYDTSDKRTTMNLKDFLLLWKRIENK